jgi:hypothetical protein
VQRQGAVPVLEDMNDEAKEVVTVLSVD